MIEQKVEAYSKPMFYRGVVEDNEDPEKLGRLKVRIYGIHSDDDSECPTDSLPWAEMAMALNHGFMSGVGYSYVPLKGTYVWVFLDCGCEDKPVVFAACPGISNTKDSGSFADPDGEFPRDNRLGESDFNRLSRGEQIDDTDIEMSLKARNDMVVPTATGGTWSEPESTNSAAQYPTNTVLETKSGHTIQIDDTEGNERIHIFHKSGSYFELRSDGDTVLHSTNNNFEIVEMDDNKHIFFNSNETINMNATRLIGMNNDEVIGNNETRLIGNNQQITIGNNRQKIVGNNCTNIIGNNLTGIVGNNETRMVANNQLITIGNNRIVTTASNDILTAGGNIIIFGSMTFIN